ncbi:pentatricopeptide repeat-containing protein At2g30100, chloroplastic isoform X2 [Punica granatum]|nr:pentatricopeptide repeat-containing protein At2g30100, chloroplastic isoform X2 [Punica granatum]XP_031385000.1 pentatricopeptide repeat-containing protein At2g30100, chloroplastic isoform X2 [Punica granatum]
MIASRICSQQKPCFIAAGPTVGKLREFRLYMSVELEQFVTSDDEDEMSEGFFEAIEELERMNRDPSDILEEMNDRLSARELQLVLVYFSQEGRDSWCALEVFEWLKKENRVDKETMELMVAIMCGWIKKLIDREHKVGDVVDLLVDMDCIGLKPSFSMIEKVISFYWEAGEKESAVSFVKEVLKRGVTYNDDNDDDGHKGGPTGYLAWKMMVEGNYKDAVGLIISFRDSGLKPEMYSYLIAMTAVVKELNEFAKAIRKLKGYSRTGVISNLDQENIELIEKYQLDLIADGVRISNWVIQEGSPSLYGIVHERLLAMYICAGRGPEAERQLWEMKLVGKEADDDLHNIVLAICASRKEVNAIQRLLTRMEVTNSLRKKTLMWLLRGYIKGGHFDEASETLIKMLDMGLSPEYLDRVAVLQGLRSRIQRSGDVDNYLKLCRRLSDANLIGPCLVYLYIKKYRLWITRML